MVPNVWNAQNLDSPAPKPQPHFCATMFQLPIPQQKLMIPTKSAMIFGEELYEVVTLTVPNGQAWQVGLEKDGGQIWLHDGLKEFLDYYSVQYFYNLNFRYEGNSVFYVCICDASGSEIDYPCDGPSRDLEPEYFGKHNEEYMRNDENVEILDVKPSISHGSSQRKRFSTDVEQQSSRERHNFLCQQTISRPTKRCRNAASVDSPLYEENRMLPHLPTLPLKHEGDAEMHVPKSLFYARSRLVISKETEKAVHVASMCKLENPSFMVILRPHNFSEKHVDVPTEFVKRHLSWCSEDIQLQVHNGERRWSVRCFYRGSRAKDGSKRMKKIGKGWRLFSSNNNLKVGDVCVFELVTKGNDVVLRVWIYRAADYATPV